MICPKKNKMIVNVFEFCRIQTVFVHNSQHQRFTPKIVSRWLSMNIDLNLLPALEICDTETAKFISTDACFCLSKMRQR